MSLVLISGRTGNGMRYTSSQLSQSLFVNGKWAGGAFVLSPKTQFTQLHFPDSLDWACMVSMRNVAKLSQEQKFTCADFPRRFLHLSQLMQSVHSTGIQNTDAPAQWGTQASCLRERPLRPPIS